MVPCLAVGTYVGRADFWGGAFAASRQERGAGACSLPPRLGFGGMCDVPAVPVAVTAIICTAVCIILYYKREREGFSYVVYVTFQGRRHDGWSVAAMPAGFCLPRLRAGQKQLNRIAT